MKKTIQIQVRTYELDSYNHVNNAVYLNYLEYARMQYLDQIGFDYAGLSSEGYMLYVTHIDIFYKASACLGDTLSIDVFPVKLGKLSGVFRQIVKNQHGTVCVEAEVTWACVNATGRPTKLPERYIIDALRP